eukprot:CAMPEP_0194216316 /NCGR_PEP_ID=MMETSP0156-20130528/18749_1 /TAXON_ID=33649 /ORGANISM="Thalassionema nitzschioides, Strain L26-B" /LENGTH=986 /DNA_ID=CAMNT_0038945061 /DNA_START=420 /DNA_END=3380 /DNA_ORIENTATION=-
MMVNKHAILQARVNIASSSPIAFEKYSNLTSSPFDREWTVILDELPGGSQEEQEFIHLEHDVDLKWENSTFFTSDLSFLVPLHPTLARTFIVSLLEISSSEKPRLITRRLANVHAIYTMPSERDSPVVSLELNGVFHYSNVSPAHFSTPAAREFAVPMTLILATIFTLGSYFLSNKCRNKYWELVDYKEETETNSPSIEENGTTSEETLDISNMSGAESCSSWDISIFSGKRSSDGKEEKGVNTQEESLVEPPSIVRYVGDSEHLCGADAKEVLKKKSRQPLYHRENDSPARKDFKVSTSATSAQAKAQHRIIRRADVTASIDISAMHSSDEEISLKGRKGSITSRSRVFNDEKENESKLAAKYLHFHDTPVRKIRSNPVREFSSIPVQQESSVASSVRHITDVKMRELHTVASSNTTPLVEGNCMQKMTDSNIEETCIGSNTQESYSQTRDFQKSQTSQKLNLSTECLHQYDNGIEKQPGNGQVEETCEFKSTISISPNNIFISAQKTPRSEKVKVKSSSAVTEGILLKQINSGTTHGMPLHAATKEDGNLDSDEKGGSLGSTIEKSPKICEKQTTQGPKLQVSSDDNNLTGRLMFVASSSETERSNCDFESKLDVVEVNVETKTPSSGFVFQHQHDVPSSVFENRPKVAEEALSNKEKDCRFVRGKENSTKTEKHSKSKVVTPVISINKRKDDALQVSDSDCDKCSLTRVKDGPSKTSRRFSGKKIPNDYIGGSLENKGQCEIEARTLIAEEPTFDIPSTSQSSQLDQNWLQRLKSRPGNNQAAIDCNSEHSPYASTLDPDSEASSSELPSPRLEEKMLIDPFEFTLDTEKSKGPNEKSTQRNDQDLKRTRDQYEPELSISCKKNGRFTSISQKTRTKTSRARLSVDNAEVMVWEPTESERLSMPPKRKKKRNKINAVLPDTTPSLEVLTKRIAAPVWQYSNARDSSKSAEKLRTAMSRACSTNPKDMVKSRKTTRCKTKIERK